MADPKLILVTGATGYRVRCLVRDPKRLEGYRWRDQVEVVGGDALVINSLDEAMCGVSVAYYLIHGRQGGQINAQRDLAVARNFAAAAEQAGRSEEHTSELQSP